MSIDVISDIVTYTYPTAQGNYANASQVHKIATVHDIECPPGKGWVRSLMGPSYFGKSGTGASAQLMVDAGDVGQGLDWEMQAYQIGGPGNQISGGIEQAGYASFSRAMFLGQEKVGATYQRPDGSIVAWTAQNNLDMAAQLELLARLLADLNRVKGIELRWLSLDELRQARDDYEAGRAPTISGFCRHIDWTRSGASNTTHVDPSDNYPTDVLMAKAIAYRNGGTPTPPPPPEEDELSAQDVADLKAAIAAVSAKVDKIPAAPTPVSIAQAVWAALPTSLAASIAKAVVVAALPNNTTLGQSVAAINTRVARVVQVTDTVVRDTVKAVINAPLSNSTTLNQSIGATNTRVARIVQKLGA